MADGGWRLDDSEVEKDLYSEVPGAKRIVRRGREWCVVAESGRNMGCYPSRAEAQERLRQIEFFKHEEEKCAPCAEAKYNENHDELGRFSSGDGGGGAGEGDTGHGGTSGIDWNTPTPEAFIEARDRGARPGYLSPLTPGDLSGSRLFMSEGGKAGFSISSDGDIQNVFSNVKGSRAGADAVVDAVANGGRTLDCFGEFLPNLYSQMGFVETGRMKFDITKAPQGWNPADGTPDVVFMAWKGYNGRSVGAVLAEAKDRSAWRQHDQSGRFYSGDKWDKAKEDSRRAVGTGERDPFAGASAHGARGKSLARAGGGHGVLAQLHAPVESWSMAELEAFMCLHGKDATDTSHEDPPTPPRGKPKKDHTLYIAAALWALMQTYDRKLQKAFDKSVGELSSLVENGSATPGRAKSVLNRLESAMLALAPVFIGKAYGIGANFAADYLGGVQLTEDASKAAIQSLVDTNASFVTGSFVPDVAKKYKSILVQGASAEETMVAIDALADSMGARVSMYSLQVWGSGHKGFVDEMESAGELLDWVTTSGNPCQDCPRLEEGSPYGPDNPLPTFPGAGDTQCLSNCLCLLQVHVPGRRKEAPVYASAQAGVGSREHEDKTLAALLHANGIALEQAKAFKALVRATEAQAAGLARLAEEIKEAQGREIVVPAPEVKVTTPEVKIDVRVPEQAPPTVNVKVPEPRKRKVRRIKRVERDENNMATGSVEIEEEL